MVSQPALVMLEGVIVGREFVSNCTIKGEQSVRSSLAPRLLSFELVWSEHAPARNGTFNLFVGGQILEIKYTEGRWMIPLGTAGNCPQTRNISPTPRH